MTTQTLRGMLEPLHWRGDRPTMNQFNPAFAPVALQILEYATYYFGPVVLVEQPSQFRNREWFRYLQQHILDPTVYPFDITAYCQGIGSDRLFRTVP